MTAAKPEQGGHGAHGHEEAMRERHRATLWAPFAVAALGGWLLSSPLAFDYRDSTLLWSDVARRSSSSSASCPSRPGPASRAGPSPASASGSSSRRFLLGAEGPVYANDTLLGTLAVAFSTLIPGMPGMRMLPGPDIPPGWSHNPSSWPQRFPPIALALVSFLLARYLAAFQLGHVDAA